ncbi:MAG: DUF99 family protein [Deltaproteobacteria bacterium]|nr:DUF99 family protein [Deltaproteobacteria bacterium]
MSRAIGNVIGIDDAPFERSYRGDVMVVGAVFSRTRLDGVVRAYVRRDGVNATRRIVEMVEGHQFREHIRAVLLQGIAVAGFNVVDIHELCRSLKRPVLVVTRRRPDLDAVRRALLERTPGGSRKWKLIERAGLMEPVGKLYVQRAGLSLAEAAAMLKVTTLHGLLPEPLRVAHLIAGGIATGASRGHA